MLLTSSIPNGSGRIRQKEANAFEIELIAYSKGSRYFCVEAVSEGRDATLNATLLPDSLFRDATFPHKRDADVWFCDAREQDWKRVKQIARSSEKVEFSLHLESDKRYLISSEPPRRYIDTTQEIVAIAASRPDICTIHMIGHSIEHRPIFALRVAAQKVAPGAEEVPVIHIVAGEHASESAGEEIARGMLTHALTRVNSDAGGEFIFDFILNSNPDGNFHGWHQYNAADWVLHNYDDTVDRSWHHEFAPYLLGAESDFCPETIALMEWMKTTRPACYISLHSWEGEKGNPGAFYSAPEILNPEMAAAARALVRISEDEGAKLGVHVCNYPCTGRDQHLGSLLMTTGTASAYLPEGNYSMGRAALQEYGAGLIKGFLEDGLIVPKSYDRGRWDKFAGESAPDLAESLNGNSKVLASL